MSEDPTRLLAAQAAIRAGNKQQARELLHEELDKNPRNFRAWLWLAGLAEAAEDSLRYVQEAERLNPADPGVLKARAWAEQRLAQQQEPIPPAVAAPAVARGTNIGNEAEGNTAQRVDQLREQQLAASETQVPRSRRRLLYGVMALIVVMLLSALLWRWDNAASSLEAGAPSRSTAAATTVSEVSNTATPTAASRVGTDTVEISFVSGQFAPRKSEGSSSEEESQDGVPPEETATPEALQAKSVNNTSNNPRATWTLTPSPTYTPTATPTPVPTFVSEEPVVVGGATRPDGVGPGERWIDVNLSTQRLVAYEGDRAVFNSLISSGTWLHPTVTGQFRVWLRYTAQTMDGRRLGYDYYLPNVPYVMYFYRDYALHGTYWHNNFGTPMSHGCVNLPTPAAEWIFNWSSIGTLVSVHY